MGIEADKGVDVLQTNPKERGRFISFEGTEGVGKTTAIKSLCSHLEDKNIGYIKTREPGGSLFAEKLRNILLDKDTDINDDTELLLVFAGRCDHIQKTIMPALEQGLWVITDRYYDSTYGYQGFGRGYGNRATLNKIESLIKHFVGIEPDLTLWMDMPLIEGMRRAGKRGAADRFEQQEIAFFERVYSGFEYQMKRNPNRIERINALGTVEEVTARVWDAVQAKFGTVNTKE
ncbi:MAG: dTMP kinase [Psychrobacter sp.]|nr:dTMP kinase [Psychrobacter sp.]